MGLHKEAESICRALGDRAGLSRSLGNQAGILQAWGRLEEAMGLHKEAESIKRALGDVNGLAISLANQALILGLNLGRRHEAIPKSEEALRLCSQHGLAALAPWVKRVLDAVRSQPK